jgi:ABC-type transporter Mla subunit MlaD
MVAATIRTVFAQPGQDAVRNQLDTVSDMLGAQFPQVKQMLLDAKDDLTAFAAFAAFAAVIAVANFYVACVSAIIVIGTSAVSAVT